MGTRPKKAAGEEDSDVFEVRVPRTLQRRLLVGFLGLIGATGGTAWVNRDAATGTAEEVAALADAVAGLQQELADLRPMLYSKAEAAEAHGLLAGSDAAIRADVAALNDRLRDVRRDRGTRTR